MRQPRAFMVSLAAVLACSGLAQGQIESAQPESARECASCHVSWMDGFRRPDALTLIDRPGEWFVSQQENCLGCHDGSVGDSRRMVWIEHRHKTGVVPPDGMKIPDALPLRDGKIDCRTCHSAHGAAAQTLASTVFIRVNNDESQLCTMCHVEQARGSEGGMHPLSQLDWPVPDELTSAGGKAGLDGKQVICQTCHTPHGSHEDDLLVLAAEGNRLCVSCHEKIHTEEGGSIATWAHHQPVPLTSDVQRQVIEEMGTRVGQGNTLICLSCHEMHGAVSTEHLLAREPATDGSFCTRCHTDQQGMLGSSHDLSVSAPEERNLLGQTVEEGGLCSPCHGVHRTTRGPIVQPGDPTGMCTTCHTKGRCAERVVFETHGHPDRVKASRVKPEVRELLYPSQENSEELMLTCWSCHNPHRTEHGRFLKAKSDNLCAMCHSDKLASLAGAHAFSQRSVKNAKGKTAAETGNCGFCHAVHNAPGPFLWAATDLDFEDANDLCLTCHQPEGLAKEALPHQLAHPTGSATKGKVAASSSLPLYGPDGHQAQGGSVACGSCHGVHGDSGATNALLHQGDVGLCLTCHADARSIAASMHRSHNMKAAMGDSLPSEVIEFCGPCHVTHVRDGMKATGMWAAPVGSDDLWPDRRQCLGCHGDAGLAKKIEFNEHPVPVSQSPKSGSESGFLPLIDEQGEECDDGRISCRTCHLQHGQILKQGLAATIDSATPSQRDQLRTMIRPYVAPNLCSQCHGFEGLLRYFNYHDWNAEQVAGD